MAPAAVRGAHQWRFLAQHTQRLENLVTVRTLEKAGVLAIARRRGRGWSTATMASILQVRGVITRPMRSLREHRFCDLMVMNNHVMLRSRRALQVESATVAGQGVQRAEGFIHDESGGRCIRARQNGHPLAHARRKARADASPSSRGPTYSNKRSASPGAAVLSERRI